MKYARHPSLFPPLFSLSLISSFVTPFYLLNCLFVLSSVSSLLSWISLLRSQFSYFLPWILFLFVSQVSSLLPWISLTLISCVSLFPPPQVSSIRSLLRFIPITHLDNHYYPPISHTSIIFHLTTNSSFFLTLSTIKFEWNDFFDERKLTISYPKQDYVWRSPHSQPFHLLFSTPQMVERSCLHICPAPTTTSLTSLLA